MSPAPRWAVVSTWLLSWLGLGIAIYLTVAHYTTPAILACSDSGTIDCLAVTTSQWSFFMGVPVAVLGLINFVVLLALNSPWVWRIPMRSLAYLRLIVATGNMAFVLWLVYAELVLINHICLYCTAVHVVTLALFLITVNAVSRQLGWSGPRTAAQ